MDMKASSTVGHRERLNGRVEPSSDEAPARRRRCSPREGEKVLAANINLEAALKFTTTTQPSPGDHVTSMALWAIVSKNARVRRRSSWTFRLGCAALA
jgi:hypothetical protein